MCLTFRFKSKYKRALEAWAQHRMWVLAHESFTCGFKTQQKGSYTSVLQAIKALVENTGSLRDCPHWSALLWSAEESAQKSLAFALWAPRCGGNASAWWAKTGCKDMTACGRFCSSDLQIHATDKWNIIIHASLIKLVGYFWCTAWIMPLFYTNPPTPPPRILISMIELQYVLVFSVTPPKEEHVLRQWNWRQGILATHFRGKSHANLTTHKGTFKLLTLFSK